MAFVIHSKKIFWVLHLSTPLSSRWSMVKYPLLCVPGSLLSSSTPSDLPKCKPLCDGWFCFAPHSICLVISPNSGMFRTIHPQESSKVGVKHLLHVNQGFPFHCSLFVASTSNLWRWWHVLLAYLLEPIKQKACATASTLTDKQEAELSLWMVAAPYFKVSHQCSLWDPVMCSFLERETPSLHPFWLLAILDSAFPDFWQTGLIRCWNLLGYSTYSLVCTSSVSWQICSKYWSTALLDPGKICSIQSAAFLCL